MIVVITGGSGFIGRKLVLRHLERGDEVRLLSRQKPDFLGYEVSWIEWDANNNASVRSFVDGADVFYHCAAEIQNIPRMHAANVELTQQLLHAVSGNVSHWVQLSSIGVYGKVREGVVTEDTVEYPCGVYERTKLEADKLVIEAAATGGFSYTVLRPSNVYGAGMTNQSLYKLVSLIDKGAFFFIGSREAKANYIHVDNVVQALMLCADRSEALDKIFNVSDMRSMESFVGTIADYLGKSKPRLRMPEGLTRVLARTLATCSAGKLNVEPAIDALTNRVIYSCTRIEKELGFKLTMSMEQGLEELVRDRQSHLAAK